MEGYGEDEEGIEAWIEKCYSLFCKFCFRSKIATSHPV